MLNERKQEPTLISLPGTEPLSMSDLNAVEAETERQKTALLFRNARVAIWVNVVNASLLAYVNSTLGISAPTALIWWCVAVGVACGRYLLSRRFLAATPDTLTSGTWRQRYIVATALTAAVWGGGTVLFMWHGPDAARLFTGLVLAGMVAGAVPILAPVPKAFLAYTLPILLPMAPVILLQAKTPLDWAFGIMVTIFIAAVLLSARYLHETLDRSISLGLKQKGLVESLEQARDAAEEALIEQKRTEDALRQSKERYRLILQYSPTGILHYSNDLVITYCNERFAQILCTPREKLIGLDMNTLKDTRILPALAMAIRGQTGTYEGEYFSTLAHTQIWVSMSCAPLRGTHGEAEGGIAIVEDITERKHDEKALRHSEARLRYMLETSPIAVRIAGSQGRKVLFANQRYAELIESTVDAMIGVDPIHYYSTPGEYEAILSSLLEGEQVTDKLVALHLPSGAVKWALASFLSMEFQHETAVLGWFYDVTEHKHAEMVLREKEEKMRGLFELSPLGIALADSNGIFVEFNEAFRKITGYSEQELQTIGYWQLTPKKYLELEAAQLNTLQQTGHYGPFEKEYARKDGTLVPVRLNGMYVTGADGNRYIWSIVEDITEHKKFAQQLELLAQTDPLTGLSNRRHFMEVAELELARTIRSAGSLSILMMDVDHFKAINDTHGHKTGDTVLTLLGELCHTALRSFDTLGRLGGEEFAILLPQTGSEQASEVAERLCQLIADTEIPMPQGLPLHFTISIGVASLRNHSTNIDTLLNKADTALYEAKRSGRNRVCVSR
jgi:diguanylate cyclase (GGDEF)-like protein/PAS domain S-box-containing protein